MGCALLVAALGVGLGCGGRVKDFSLEQAVFASCVESSDCASHECLCGICTRTCESSDTCSDIPSAICARTGDSAHALYCAGRDSPALCLPSCTEDRDCPSGRCIQQTCAPDVDPALLTGPPPENGPPRASFCAESPVVWRTLELRTQEDFDALEGCEVIEGDLIVEANAKVDPRGLAGLRQVTGTLSVVRPDSNEAQRDAPLAGLEGLREVGSINLQRLNLPSLEGLSGLQRVETFFRISSCSELEELRGLDSLTEADVLLLRSLPDLQGLEGAANLQRLNSLTIDVAPRLEGLQGLGTLDVAFVGLTGTPLQNLTSLGRLVGLKGLSLNRNAQLESLAGLPDGAALDALKVEESLELTSLVGLEQLGRVRELSLLNNEGLLSLAGLPASAGVEALLVQGSPQLTTLEGVPWAAQVTSIELSRVSLSSLQLGELTLNSLSVSEAAELNNLLGLESVRGLQGLSLNSNRNLTSLEGLPDLEALLSLELRSNPALLELPAEVLGVSTLRDLTIQQSSFTALDFSNLTELRSLRIEENKSLQRLSFDALLDVTEVLSVRSNPRLQPEQLELFSSFSAASQFNMGAQLPLESCPWTNDGACDETSGICAVGSDANDCEGSP